MCSRSASKSASRSSRPTTRAACACPSRPSAASSSNRLAAPNRHRNRNRKLNKRSEEHTSELQSLMRISYAVFCLKTKKQHNSNQQLKEVNTVNVYNTERTDEHTHA